MTINTNTANTADGADETLNRFKVMTPIQRMEIVEGVVDAILNNLAAVEAGRDAAAEAEKGQLAALKIALKDYAEPMTEEVWDKVYRPSVAARLDEAKIDGSPRYKNNASRDVMVNLIKVATMGFTLAKHDRNFVPSLNARTSLKKYATEVRPKLQAALDPATGEPRLRSIATPPKKAKKLPKGNLYLLIGCEVADRGISAANTVIGASRDLDQLKKKARKLSTKYATFLYVPAPPLQPLDWEDDHERDEMPIQNSAVFGQSFSPPPEQAPA